MSHTSKVPHPPLSRRERDKYYLLPSGEGLGMREKRGFCYA